MRASLRRGRDEVVLRIPQVLNLFTKKEAEQIFNVVGDCIENTLLNNLGSDGFTIKLNTFGKFHGGLHHNGQPPLPQAKLGGCHSVADLLPTVWKQTTDNKIACVNQNDRGQSDSWHSQPSQETSIARRNHL